MINRPEQARRGQSLRKPSTKHPYAAIEHRVIDSDAYADLTFSERSLLVLMTRQLTKDNNGRLQATYSYLRRFGFDSDRTITRAVAGLIAHGMIYRTRSGGYQQGAAQYAVTWLPLCKDREGLFADNFKPCAWRDWEPSGKKSPPTNLRPSNRKNGGLTPTVADKFAVMGDDKFADIELVPCSRANVARRLIPVGKSRAPSYASPCLIRRQTTADRCQFRAGVFSESGNRANSATQRG